MTTITTDGSDLDGGPRRVAFDSNGNIWAMIWNTTANDWEFWYSTDDGANWTENTDLAITPQDTTPSYGAFAINTNGGTDIAVCYTEAVGNARFISGLTTTSDAWATVGSTGNGLVSDVVVFPKPSSSNFYIASIGAITSPFAQSTLRVFEVTAAGVYVGTAGLASGAVVGDTGGSLDWNHTGNGSTTAGGAPHIYGAAIETSTSPDTVVFRKLSWTGSGFSAGSTRTLGDTTSTCTAGAFDGSRFLVAANGTTAGVVSLFQRDAGDTTTTNLGNTPDLGGTVEMPVVVIDTTSQDVYIVATDNTNLDVDYVEWSRATATWDGSWTSIADAVTVEGPLTLTATKSQPGSFAPVIWDQTTTDAVYDAIDYNHAPTAATWVSPSEASAQDVTAALALAWTFNDPNPGDTQGAYALKRTVGAVVRYWNAGGSSWDVAEVKNVSTTEGVTVATAWATDEDAVAFAVKTWDDSDVAGVYGSALNLVASTPVTPALSAPADAGTITTNKVTAEWSVAEATAYRLRILLASNDSQLYDTGKVVSTATSVQLDYVLANSTEYKVEVRTWNTQGLVSATDTHTFTTGFVAPMTPTLVVTAEAASGRIKITVTDPTPSGDPLPPTVTGHDLFVRVASGGRQDGERPVVGAGIRIIDNDAATTLYDYASGSGISYEYLVRSHASSTGTSADSAWT